MVSPVSASHPVQHAHQTQNVQHQQAKPASNKSSEPQDTVHLSNAAKTTGDVDHDGDSK
jgi:hypothetical protein